jgi:methylenetetrahydrofolate reductase (NADPH)
MCESNSSQSEAALRQGIVALMQGASFEISARDPLAGDALRDLVGRAATVYISAAPGGTHHGILAAAARLTRAGFKPVPHVTARSLMSFTQLNDYLVRMAGEAGVERALVVAGDIERPVGPFESSLQLLETGLFEKHGIRQIDLAAYPEGHPKIAKRTLDAALLAKLQSARARGLAPGILTQFGFEAAPIVEWLRGARGAAIDAPVRVGLAGPASIATLAKFAVRCGVGNSLRALAGGRASLARLLVEADPARVIAELASAEGAAIAGLHFFTFGGVRRSCAWIDAILRGDFAISDDGQGFRVRR